MAPNYLNTDNTVIRAGVEQDAATKENAIISATLDFAAEQTYIFDPTVYQQAGTFAGNVQALFLDNSTNPKPALVTVDQSGQQFPVPPYSTGWYQIVSNLNSKITIYSLGGSLNGSKSFAQFTNYPKEPVVYFGFSPLTDGARVKVIGVDDTTNMGITNPLIVGGWDGAVARTLKTDITGKLEVVGTSGGGVAFGPDAPGVVPTQNPVQLGGIDPGGLIRRILTTAAGLLRVNVDASALPTGAATEVTSASILTQANLLATEVTSASILTRANLLATEVTSAAILTRANLLATEATSALIKTATDAIEVATEATQANTTRGITATVTTNALAGASVTILTSDATRKSWSVYNDGTVTIYLRFGAVAASATGFTVPLVAGAYYENEIYNGEVRAFGASGTLRVTSNA